MGKVVMDWTEQAPDSPMARSSNRDRGSAGAHGRRAFIKRVIGGAGTAAVGMVVGAVEIAAEGELPRQGSAAASRGSSPRSSRASRRSPGAQASPLGRLDHVAVPIENVEEMVSFYRALGFEVREGDSIISVHFQDQKINFHRPSLWQADSFTLRASGARPPCGDFCWVWEGDAESLREALGRAGAEIVSEGERQGGRGGGTAVGQSIYTRDPDGNLLEFLRY